MKNQLDLIISGVALVIALIAAGAFWGTKRTVTPKPAPSTVNIAKVSLPASDVAFGTALPTDTSTATASMAGSGAGTGASSGPSKTRSNKLAAMGGG